MSDASGELDLKFLPDWLKETPGVNRYADYQGDTGERSRYGGGDRRPGQGRGDQRGPRRDGPPPPRGRDDRKGGRPGGQPRGDRPGGPPRGDRRGGGGGGGQSFGKSRSFEREERAPRPAPIPTAEVRIEFLPEPNGLAGIARQIKSGTRAYPLFGTARLFLEKPERHRVRITSQDPAIPLYQCGDGPVSFDRAAIERTAFREMKDQYYREDVVQGEPPKGNFGNVARCRTTGTLLGPTNYHGYQPALRKLYEERFSRRMSFPEFQQLEIQVLSDEQAIADWKEQARTTTTYVTLQEAEPLTFKSMTDAELHFRKTYLSGLVKSGVTLETSGPASRATGDRSIGSALRNAWEQEKQFPQNLVNQLRPAFQDAGLHYFKHRKRMLYVSPIRPQRAPKGQVLADALATLLATIEASPKCTRHDLAVKILGEQHDAPEAAPRKASMASDLHYLVQAGHVIEFHDGTLDLPLVPGDPQKPASAGKAGAPTAAAAIASEAENASTEDEGEQAAAAASAATGQEEAPGSELAEASAESGASTSAPDVEDTAAPEPTTSASPEPAAPVAAEADPAISLDSVPEAAPAENPAANADALPVEGSADSSIIAQASADPATPQSDTDSPDSGDAKSPHPDSGA